MVVSATGERELLGAVAYGELSAFDRLAEDARLAPDLADRVRMTAIAVTEFEHHARISERLAGLGVDPVEAMEPFRRPFDEFHRLTRPKTWYEGLLKAYLGAGLAGDLYREVADLIGDDTRELVYSVVNDPGFDDFVVDRVVAAIKADPDQAGRLALWGRRLVGEAMSQAQRVIGEQPALTGLLADPDAGRDLADVGRLFTRLIENHARRMKRLGLSA